MLRDESISSEQCEGKTQVELLITHAFFAKHRKEIGHTRIATLLAEERRDLAAVMRLMVEDVGNGPPQWGLLLLTTTHVDEGRREVFGGELGGPSRECIVGQCSLAAEFIKVGIELLVEGPNASGTDGSFSDRLADKPREPDSVGKQEMVECAVDRFEKRPLVAFAFLVAQRGGGLVELEVHPAVVAGESR